MNYTEEDLDNLRRALLRGEKRVRMDGREVEYRSPDEIKEAIEHVQESIRKQAKPMEGRLRYCTFRGKGL